MILFLDDEPTIDLFYEAVAERGFPISRFTNVDDAWNFITKTKTKVDLAIIDVMMPPGNLLINADTGDGLYTGLKFYLLLREKLANTIIYLLTNLTDPLVALTIEGDEKAYLAVKTDKFYDEFAEEIEKLYREQRNQ